MMMKKLIAAMTAGIMSFSMAAASMTCVDAADQSAIEIVNDMGLGWNLGNTFDCWNTRGWTTDTETAWGNPRTTKDMITAIHASGFNSVRIPITWYENTDANTFDIDDAYLARVKEVVDYAYDQGMYVIINMHWDWVTDASANLWLNKGLDALPQFTTMWTEIGNYFKDYDQHLVFEDMNEVAWQENPYAGYNENSYNTLNKLNAEFVSTIRKTGGNNANRLLLLAGANTDLDGTCNSQFIVPDDKMVAVSIHYYRPSTFCVADTSSNWGYSATWGTDADVNALKNDFAKMKSTFMDKGVPVILGEYGVITNAAGAKDKDSIYKFLKTVASTSLETDGITCYLWDAGNAGDMQCFDRKQLEWFDPNIKAIYAELGGSTDTPSFEVKNRITIPISEVPTDDGGYRIDLTPYAATGAKLTGALIKGKITSGESVGYGFGFEAVRNGSGSPVWTGEPAILGSDGILNVEFDGKGQDDDGTAYTYELNMRYLQIQQWWTTPATGATAELESVTLIFDKDIETGETPTEKETEAPTEEVTEAPTEETQAPTEETQAPTEETQAPTEETEAPTEETQAPTEETQAPTEETEAPTEETEAPTEETQASTDATAPRTDVKYGDVNGDGEISIMDVIALNKFLIGTKELDQDAQAAADANLDGDVSSEDSLLILKYALEVIDTLPVPKNK